MTDRIAEIMVLLGVDEPTAIFIAAIEDGEIDGDQTIIDGDD